MLLVLGLIAALFGLGVLLSSALPRFRSRWKRRAGQVLGAALSGFVVGSLLLRSPAKPGAAAVTVPVPPVPASRVAQTAPAAAPPAAASTAPAAVPAAGDVLLIYVQGQQDEVGFQSGEVRRKLHNIMQMDARKRRAAVGALEKVLGKGE